MSRMSSAAVRGWFLLWVCAVGCSSQDARPHARLDASRDEERARELAGAEDARVEGHSADADELDAAVRPMRDARARDAGGAGAPADPEANAQSEAEGAAERGARATDAAAGQDAEPPTDAAAASAAPAMDAGAGLSPQQAADAAAELPPVTCAPFQMPSDCTLPDNSSLPTSLRCAGLYADIERGQLACGLTEYAPAYELWSDGAVKRRWVSIPAGASVDTRDPDGFVYPVGTEFWKEFSVVKDGELRRAETRLLRKVARGWVLATYVWSEDGRSATSTNNGVADWAETGHTIPTRDQCVECHAGRKDLVLGWDPVLLGPGARGVQLSDLAPSTLGDEDAGTLPGEATPPGDAVERAALGYLHVNCGVSCHNDSIEARARDTALYLRLSTGRADGVLESPAVKTAINKLPTGNAPFYELPEPAEGPFYDLLPGSPQRSLLLARMLVRDHPAQMPPLASNEVDEQGAAAVSAWIEQMTPERGYPAPVLDPVTEPAEPPL